MSRILKPITVLKRWEAIPIAQRNSRIAKQYAKMAGMKSMGEVRCAADMDTREISWKYEAERLGYQYKPAKYTPDFTLYDDGNLLIEYKGKMTDQTRKKLIAIKRCNPNRRVCIVFEKPNNKLSSKKGAWRYWQWAERNGFEWSEHYVKEEWLSE